MNDTNKMLLFVGLGVIFCLIWLSRNDIVFNKKINLILHASYVQGNLLDKNMDVIPKGRKTSDSPKCMPINGDNDNGDLCKTWMAI
jgi:hypothetical protein